MSDEDPLEDMMNQLGEFGMYQLFQHFLHSLLPFFAGLHVYALTFTASTPPHRCRINEVDGNKPQFDSDFNYNEEESKDLFKESKIKDYIPKDKDGKFSSCEIKVKAGGNVTTTCSRHMFQFTDYHPTSYVVQYELICKNKYKRPLMRSVYVFGILIGAITLGPLSDKVGRKPIMCICALLQPFFAIISSLVNNYWAHLVVTCMYGAFATGGALITGYLLTMELVGTSRRTRCGTNLTFMYRFGSLLLVLSAYFEPNAMYLQLLLGCYSLVMAGHWWLCDESIRWLWGAGKRKEAIKVAMKAARWNKIEFEDRYSDKIEETAKPNDTIPKDVETPSKLEKPSDTITNETPTRQDKPSETIVNNVHTSTKQDLRGLFGLLKCRVLRLRLLLVTFNWFANSLIIYGITFNANDLSESGDPYINFFLIQLAEIPGLVIVRFGVPYTGNRVIMSLSMAIGGIMCFICYELDYIPSENIVSTFALVAVSISFSVLYKYSAELFPTVARGSAFGICSMGARIAGIFTPMLSLLDKNHTQIPLLFFGIVALVAALASTFLPETQDVKLLQTMLDGENFKIGDTAFSGCRHKPNRVDTIEVIEEQPEGVTT